MQVAGRPCGPSSYSLPLAPIPLPTAQDVREGTFRARLVTSIVFCPFAYLSQLSLVEYMQTKYQHLHVEWLPACPLPAS